LSEAGIWALRQDIFALVLHLELIRASDSSKNSKKGAAGAPDWDTFHLPKFSVKNAFARAP
jgi:hypothetical protein